MATRRRSRPGQVHPGYVGVLLLIVLVPLCFVYGWPMVGIAALGTWLLAMVWPRPDRVVLGKSYPEGSREEAQQRRYRLVRVGRKRLLPFGRWAGVASGWRTREDRKVGPELWGGKLRELRTSALPFMAAAVTAGCLPASYTVFRVCNAVGAWMLLSGLGSLRRLSKTVPGEPIVPPGSLEGAGLRAPAVSELDDDMVDEDGGRGWLRRVADRVRAVGSVVGAFGLGRLVAGAVPGVAVGYVVWRLTGESQRWERVVDLFSSRSTPDFLVRVVPLPLPEWQRWALGIGAGATVALGWWAVGAGRRSQLRFWERQEEISTWNAHWVNAGVPRPDVPIFHTSGVLRGFDGGEVGRWVRFSTQPGRDPAQLLGREAKLRSALITTLLASYMSADAASKRAGVRSPIGVEVAWATSPLGDTPHLRADLPERIASLALRSAMNEAVGSVKLPRPELVSVAALHRSGSERPLWRTTWRLYGGATLDKFLKAETAIASVLRAPWVRLEPGTAVGDLVAYVGFPPADVELASKRVAAQLERVEWAYVFRVAGLASRGGEAPQLVGVELAADRGSAVNKAVFELPKGITINEAMRQRGQVQKESRNAHLEIRGVPGSPSQLEVLYSATDPLPTNLPLADGQGRYEAIVAAPWHRMPIGLSVDGVMWWDLVSAPHALFAGSTGSGKSSAMQNVIATAVKRRWQVWLLDPKRTEFATWTGLVDAIATGNEECWSMLTEALAEMERRQKMMETAGVRFWQELDDPPPPLLIAIDEAFRLLTDVPMPSPDRDEQRERDWLKKAATGAIFRIAGFGRAMGVHLLCAMQSPTATSSQFAEFRRNLACRLLLGAPDEAVTKMMFDGMSVDLVGIAGRGMWRQTGMVSPIEVQSYWIENLDRFLVSQFDDSFRKETRLSTLAAAPPMPPVELGEDGPVPAAEIWDESAPAPVTAGWTVPAADGGRFDPKAPVAAAEVQRPVTPSAAVDDASSGDDELTFSLDDL